MRGAPAMRRRGSAPLAAHCQFLEEIPMLETNNGSRGRALGEQVQRSPGKCLHEIFTAIALAHPERVAVSTPEDDISYGELNARADRLACTLRALGVGPDVLVGLYVDRSIDMIVGLLAILKAGGAYVPIDPTYPPARVQLLIRDSAVSVIVSVSRIASLGLRDCEAKVVFADQDPAPVGAAPSGSPPASVSDGNVAYVIYTSGSTGKPKGVLVEHRNVVRLFEQTHAWFGFDERDVWTMFHSISFDFSVWEIWGALLYGGRLVVVPFDVSRSPARFLALLHEKRVTVLNQTPSAFRQLVAADLACDSPAALSLRLVIFGGERLDTQQLAPWMARRGDQHPQLINMYGITETTVHASYRPVVRGDLAEPEISPIGVPLPDLRFYLLDEAGQPVPDGVPGELYVAGAGVARGYLNRPELTAERFLRSPFGDADGTHLYRSGDRVVRRPNGEYAYLGRTDDQIKVRGFRIEPREIELCLNGHPEVLASVVVPHDYGDGDVRLVAYLVPRPGVQLDISWASKIGADLQARATAALPVHMRPSAYVAMASLPLTAHGKIDRAALPAPAAGQRLESTGVSATSPTEMWVEALWREILDVPRVGKDDDFFDLGGTSLALIRMFGRVNDRFGTDLDPAVMGDGATIAQLASSIDKALNNK
ncbi:amino acid adenylation domain-containing protein [Sorangium sp. So ce834]|uniref:amino acid adenylation domain-containing protein n=1 Tax=Sorangium sp. So ce834 TaxID=3133321 RepID=UPI003F632CD6